MKEQKQPRVFVAVTIVGHIVYHKQDKSDKWHEPCVLQPLPDGRNVNIDRYGKFFENEGKSIDPIDNQFIVSHAKASEKVKRIYWNSLEQFRVAESGIVKPSGKQVIDIGKNKDQ